MKGDLGDHLVLTKPHIIQVRKLKTWRHGAGSLPLRFSVHEGLFLLSSSGLAAHHPKANNQGASVGRKERCCNQKSWQTGEKVDSCPEANSGDSGQL